MQANIFGELLFSVASGRAMKNCGGIDLLQLSMVFLGRSGRGSFKNLGIYVY